MTDGRTDFLTRETIDRMVNVIVREVDPLQIILFGSHARNDATEASDVDLLIVEREPFGVRRSRRKEMAKLWRALARFPVSKDILVYSRDEMERWQGSVNHVAGRAIREGQCIYERT